jgi:hypothetical protein
MRTRLLQSRQQRAPLTFGIGPEQRNRICNTIRRVRGRGERFDH